MQSFLPFPKFDQCAAVLDGHRLNKQITECEQIVRALDDPDYGWQHHPAVQMWVGYRDALVCYGLVMYAEWQQRLRDGKRGGKLEHVSGERLLATKTINRAPLPSWLGREDIHSSHRACLLAKDFTYYSQFGWLEQPTPQVNGSWPYVWPKGN
jgi:hypothetical protein